MSYENSPDDVVKLYEQGKLSGWDGKEAADKFWEKLKTHPKMFHSVGSQLGLYGASEDCKMMLYEVVRKVLGEDTKNYPQLTGDCVSFGMKNALEYLQCTEILLNKKNHKFRPISSLYLYYLCRVVHGFSVCLIPGATGGAMAEGVLEDGSVFLDEPGVPSYSGFEATKWGCRLFSLSHRRFLEIGRKNLIGSAARVNNWEDLVAAICNGYPVTVASNQGFKYSVDGDGFHRASGRWAHQMCIIGVGKYKDVDYCIILNSWGDKFGRLKDFDNPSIELPIGCLRVRRDDMEKSMIENGECFAISAWANLPDNNSKLKRELFSPI